MFRPVSKLDNWVVWPQRDWPPNGCFPMWGAWLAHSAQQIKLQLLCHFTGGRSSALAQANDEQRYVRGGAEDVVVLISSIPCFQGSDCFDIFLEVLAQLSLRVHLQIPLLHWLRERGESSCGRLILRKFKHVIDDQSEKTFFSQLNIKYSGTCNCAVGTQTWLWSTQVTHWCEERYLHRIGQCSQMQ